MPETADIPDATTAAQQQLADMLADAIAQAMAGIEKKNMTKPPSEYNGDRAKFEDWRDAVVIHADEIRSDRRKIQMTLSHMTGGSAKTWAHNWRQNNQDEVAADVILWKSFLRQLDDQFRSPHLQSEALETLLRLRLRKDETAVTFFGTYDKYAKEAGMTDTAHDVFHVNHLESVLPQELKEAMARQAQTKLDATLGVIEIMDLSAAEKRAAIKKAEDVHWTYETLKKACIGADKTSRLWVYQTKRTGWWKNSPSKTTNPYKDDVPMDVDGVRTVKVSKEEAMKRGLCFKCQKPGHRFFECPDKGKKKADANKSKSAIRATGTSKPIDDMDLDELKAFVKTREDYIAKITAEHDKMPGMSFGSPRE